MSRCAFLPLRPVSVGIALAVLAGLMAGVIRADAPGNAIALRQRYAGAVERWPAATLDAGVAFVELGSPPARRPPGADDRRWAALGERLFHDPRLSAGNDVSCASCHRGAAGWTTPAAVAVGHDGRRGRRNPPSLSTASWRRHLAWDGSGTSLAVQSLRPLTQADEMGNAGLAAVVGRVRADAGYVAEVADLTAGGEVTVDAIAKALVAFQQTLDTPTRFDRFVAGDRTALSDHEIDGLHLFRTKARCANCHFGPLLSDERFHNLRISFFGEKSEDLGRYAVTGDPDDVGRFRTPSLRHVSRTAPYMHNGLFETLEGVVNLYDRGGGEVWARNRAEAAHPRYPFAAALSPHIRPLGLSEAEKAALVAFLRAL